MSKLLHAGSHRLRNYLGFWLTIIATIALSLLFCFANYSRDIDKQLDLEEMMFMFYSMSPFILATFCSLFLGGEYEDGCLRNKIIAGHSRGEIYFANLILCTAVTLIIWLIHMLIDGSLGMILFEQRSMSLEQEIYLAICGLLASVAYASIFVCISMNCSRKALGVVISLILVLGLIYFAQYIHSNLRAGEFIYDYVNYVGEKIEYGPLVENPDYISGFQRNAFEFLEDLPFGQLINLGNLELDRSERWPWISVVCYLIFTILGFELFRKKDIK